MGRRYRLTDCYELLQVDPKTFRRWIEKAQIVPQESKADDRVKYLTEEQLKELAELHEREIPTSIPQQDATLAPGTYKLLIERIDDVQALAQKVEELAKGTDLSFVRFQEHYTGDLETMTQNLESLVRDLQQQQTELINAQELAIGSQIEDLQQNATLMRQQQESILQLLTSQEQAIKQNRINLAEQDERQQQRLQGFAETSMQRDDQLSANLHQLELQKSQQHQDIWGRLHALSEDLKEYEKTLDQAQENAGQRLQDAIVSVQKDIRQATDQVLQHANRIAAEGREHLHQELSSQLEERIHTVESLAAERIARLETQLGEERNAREALAAQVAQLLKQQKPAPKSRRSTTAANKEGEQQP